MNKQLENIKEYTLIFDLGNVIIDVFFDKFYTNIVKRFNIQISQSEFMEKLTPVNMDCNNGLLSELKFYEKFIEIFEIKKDLLNFIDFKNLWCDIFSLNKTMHDYITYLRKKNKYQIILASNTDPIHYKFIKEKYDLSFLDEEFLSYKEKEIKPNSSFFKKLIKKYNLNLSKTIFIDDLKDNCLSAEKEAINSIQNINPNDTITKLNTLLNSNP